MRSLIRAQADIDVEPERYKHYFINEIPERFRDKVDVRRFGVGERVVPQPYTQAMFEKTQAWLHERKLFDVAPDAGVPAMKGLSFLVFHRLADFCSPGFLKE